MMNSNTLLIIPALILGGLAYTSYNVFKAWDEEYEMSQGVCLTQYQTITFKVVNNQLWCDSEGWVRAVDREHTQ